MKFFLNGKSFNDNNLFRQEKLYFNKVLIKIVYLFIVICVGFRDLKKQTEKEKAATAFCGNNFGGNDVKQSSTIASAS